MDAFNVNYAQAAGALDDRAVMYLKEIGRRARKRLLLYHYYVKGAYEYRLLKPYPTRLTLQNLFDRFRTIGETAAQQEGINTFHRLSAAEFGQLRGIYDDALGELVREVVVEHNRNAPPQLAPRLLGLSAEEVSLLNQGKPVALDLRTVGGGLFTAGEENVRIVNLRVKQLEYEPRGVAVPSDELTLRISHGGESTIWTSAGDRPRAHQFVHYTEATERPVQWGARLFPWNDELTQIIRSPSADSLLGALLNQSGNDPQKGGFFTSLGGLCTLNLSLETRGAGLRLKNAVLEVHYEHVQRRSSLRSLEFSTSDGLPAYIELSRADLAADGATAWAPSGASSPPAPRSFFPRLTGWATCALRALPKSRRIRRPRELPARACRSSPVTTNPPAPACHPRSMVNGIWSRWRWTRTARSRRATSRWHRWNCGSERPRPPARCPSS